MKQFLSILILCIVIAGCSDNVATSEETSKTTVKREPTKDVQSNSIQRGINDVDVDTIGMAEFLALKAAQAARNKQSTSIQSEPDVNDVNVDTIGWAEFKRLKAETARQAYEDSIRRAEIIADRRETIANSEKTMSEQKSRSNTTPKSSKQTKSKVQDKSPDQTDVVKESPENVKEKKGWSKKAKGAVIGAATGAAAGAVINKKNRAVGGVVGGVIGAAAGYGIGRHKDKQDTVRKEVIKDTTDQQQ